MKRYSRISFQDSAPKQVVNVSPYGRPGPDVRPWLIRPDDLLVFDVDYVNMRIEPGVGNGAAHIVADGSGPAYLILILPPQHLAEIAYFTTVSSLPILEPSPPLKDLRGKDIPVDPDLHTSDEQPDDPPIASRIAGWSRLVFKVPDGLPPIEWTSDGVLRSICNLELSIAANALPAQDLSHRAGPFPGAALVSVRGAGSPPQLTTGAAGRTEGQTAVPNVTALAGAIGRLGGASYLLVTAQQRRTLRMAAHLYRFQEGPAGRDLIDRLTQPPSLVPALLRPGPRAPSPTETAIELPYHLILSPNRYAAWFHSDLPSTSAKTGRTELWHTRLGSRAEDGTQFEGASSSRTVRAVWSLDDIPPSTPPAVPPPSNDPFRMSLDMSDRHNIVLLSSNFQLRQWNDVKRFYEPEPIDIELLALSSLGGWLDSRGSWHDQPLGLSVEEWRHRATLGRDHYVRVVYAGRLFPLGHRASLVKVTERQLDEATTGTRAYLHQRMFVVVREPLRSYRASGWTYWGDDPDRKDERYDLKFPFTSARITTLVSPLLDDPDKTEIAPSVGRGAFWPYVGGQPYRFHVVALDVDGRTADLAMPLIFIGQEHSDGPWGAVVPEKVLQEYATRRWPKDVGQLLATVPMGGQRIAFANSNGRGETSFATRALTFAGEVPSQDIYAQLSPRDARYIPTITGAEIDVPSLQAIARTSDPASVIFDHTYLRDEFTGENTGQLFLAADPDPGAKKLDVMFSKHSDRSGGLVSPDMSLTAVSRITGPVSGDLGPATKGSFDPGAWFGATLAAQLFGALKLADIIALAGFQAIDKIPRFTGGSLDQVRRLIADLERLQRLIAGSGAAEIAGASLLLDELLDPVTGSINRLASGGSVAEVLSQLAALKPELHSLSTAILATSLPAGARAVASEAAMSLEGSIGSLVANQQLLSDFAAGRQLPESMAARFEWRPALVTTQLFKPGTMILSVESAGDDLVVTCSLDQFKLDLSVLLLEFDHVQFRTRSGRKPEVDVVFTGFKFEGPLSFVETLRELIPFSGFSDPPSVQVTDEGISAGFSMGLPNIAIGVFSLENLSLAAGFAVPFTGPPLTTWFHFCERENPACLTVTIFGGGFFFGVTVDAHGLQIAEGAIEFGAAISIDFGVASGGVSAMAGLYFKLESSDVTLAGYFRLRGEVEALAIVSVCIELYLEMRYESNSHKCVGTATIEVEVDVAMFSTSISITCTKKFAGSGSDPTLADTLDIAADGSSQDWNLYCAAFAA